MAVRLSARTFWPRVGGYSQSRARFGINRNAHFGAGVASFFPPSPSFLSPAAAADEPPFPSPHPDPPQPVSSPSSPMW